MTTDYATWFDGLDDEKKAKVTKDRANREEAKVARENANNFDTFKPGDPVSWAAGTDTEPGTVSRVTPSAIFVKAVKAKLLNSTESGEPDALHFEPGGFVGHTSGAQRYEFTEDPDAAEMKFTKRAATAYRAEKAKLKGTSTRGSMSSWGILYHGHSKHYDYNF